MAKKKKKQPPSVPIAKVQKKRPPGVKRLIPVTIAGNTKASSAGSALAKYRWSMTSASDKAQTMAKLRRKKLLKSKAATGQAKFQQDEKARKNNNARILKLQTDTQDRKDLAAGKKKAALAKERKRLEAVQAKELGGMSSRRPRPIRGGPGSAF